MLPPLPILSAMPATAVPEANARFWQQAVALADTRNYDALTALAEAALRDAPDDLNALTILGMAYLGASRRHDCGALLKQVVAVAPDIALAQHLLATLLLGSGGHEPLARARGHARAAYARAPDWVANGFLLGKLCSHIGPTADAARFLAEVVERAPDHREAHLLLGEVYGALHETTLGQRHLETAAKLGQLPAGAQADLTRLRAGAKAERRRVIRARYPDTEDLQQHFTDTIKKTILVELDDAPRFIRPGTKFFTMGSCFAGNVARVLRRRGYSTTYLEAGEIVNTTYANSCLMGWADRTIDAETDARMEAILGPLISREGLIKALSEADAFIYTLGVAACFFERGTNRFILPESRQLALQAFAEHYEFRTTSVQENLDNMLRMIARLRELNPALKIFITVSPVPMQSTFERKSAVLADCMSKSTLRLVADQLCRSDLKDIFYWPSFEIVRWMSGHVGPFFGTDDGASWHVSEGLVQQIIDLFVDRFTEPMPAGDHAA